jgi:two-component system, sensor histidine kinase and response regulator
VLTDDEKVWLSEHQDIRLGVNPSRLPFELLDENKAYSGIAFDYVRIISERLNTQVSALSEHLNIHMAPVPNLTWDQVLEKAKAGDIDVIPCIAKTPEREKSYLFTKPYVSYPIVIVTRQDAPFVNGIKDFADNRVAVLKDYATRELLEQDFPGRKFYLAANWEEALEALSKGKVDAFVENLASITYITQKLGQTHLKVAATMPYSIGLSLAVRKDWPILVNILDKAIDSISESEKAMINNRWINVRFEREVDWSMIYKIVIPIVLVGGLLLVTFAAWTRRLSKEVTQRKRVERELADAEERSRLILESAGEGIIGVEPNGKITFVNPSAVQMLGYSTEELVGQGLHNLVHHSRADGSAYPKEDCPMYESYARGKANRVDDEVLWRKDGGSFPVEYASTPVMKEGTVVGAVVTFRDITERKKMDAELKEYVTDLEQFNRLVIGREEKMIQLKEEINGLMEKLGQEKKYKIVQ